MYFKTNCWNHNNNSKLSAVCTGIVKVGATIAREQWGERRGNQKSDFNVWIVKNNQQDPSAPTTITISHHTTYQLLTPTDQLKESQSKRLSNLCFDLRVWQSSNCIYYSVWLRCDWGVTPSFPHSDLSHCNLRIFPSQLVAHQPRAPAGNNL